LIKHVYQTAVCIPLWNWTVG